MTRPPRSGSPHRGRPTNSVAEPARAGLPWVWGVAAALACLTPREAAADVDAGRLFDMLSRDRSGLEAARALGLSDDSLGITAELPPGVSARERGLTPVAGRLAVARGTLASLQQIIAQNPDVRFRWSPPLRPQLDHVARWTSSGAARESTGLTGAGVVVGVIDTGVDTKHPALRHPDGSTRVRWLIDFAEQPQGRHQELEAAFGCTGDNPCAVLSAADIDERLLNALEGDEPTDVVGHGTHVASIAAGNGEPDGTYLGTAPEADLIVAQVGTGPAGAIFDVNILMSARFVFDRAQALGRPAVVNVSLGSNFGGHDGTSALEVGLATLLDRPGRAIVVASGNSAGQYPGLSEALPSPFGIHAEVHVAPAGTTRVPLVSPALTSRPTRGAIFTWVASAPGDDLRIGFANGRGGSTPLLARGRAAAFRARELGDQDDYTVSIVNGVADNAHGVALPQHGAIVIVAGEWRAGRTFALHLEGNGTARIWVDGSGDLEPGRGLGPLLPASRKAGTISIPASHPTLIAVGATTNRTSWVDHSGAPIDQPAHGALTDAPGDTTAYFSAAGPTGTGALKPDVVAPGVNIVAAMSAEADPRSSGNVLSQFRGSGPCPGGGACLVVSDHYALASGTSMAAPVVTGAVALLLQREPDLANDQIRALLQAGSRPLEGAVFAPEQVGAGALDVVGALLAQDAAQSAAQGAAQGAATLPSVARIEVAQSFVYPDVNLPLRALVVLRDDAGRPAGGFAAHRLTAHAPGAAHVALEPVTPGLWRLDLAMPAGSGGSSVELTVAFDGEPIGSRALPVAVDPQVADSGFRASGGCAVGASNIGTSAIGPAGARWLLLSVGLTLPLLRRRHHP